MGIDILYRRTVTPNVIYKRSQNILGLVGRSYTRLHYTVYIWRIGPILFENVDYMYIYVYIHVYVLGDSNKRDPDRENWPCRVILPILPIQSISGSRSLPSPGTYMLYVYCYKICPSALPSHLLQSIMRVGGFVISHFVIRIIIWPLSTFLTHCRILTKALSNTIRATFN